MAGKSSTSRPRRDLDAARIQTDEKAVQSLISTIEAMANPFVCEKDGLVCISSGVVASEEIQKDLMRAEEVGQLAFTDFIERRLCGEEEEGREKDIFTPIKHQKLKTFANAIEHTPSDELISPSFGSL